MEEYRRRVEEGKAVFVGVDLHRVKWHVTVRTEDDQLFRGMALIHLSVLARFIHQSN